MRSAKFLIILMLLALIGVSSALADGYTADSDGEVTGAASDPAARSKQMDMAAQVQRAPRMEQMSSEELSAAVGHYARARSLLLAAIREFDNGYKKARPDAIIDSKEWRNDLINRAEDLERILAPQARASKHGVRYEGDPRLLSTEAK